MEISKRHKIYLLIIVTLAVALAVRWLYFHNKWRTVEMKKEKYEISYPADWFDSTHKAIRGPVGRWISLEVTNFPFVNSMMIRVYDDFKSPTTDDAEHWATRIIEKDGCKTWSQPEEVHISSAISPGVMLVCVDDVDYYRKIVAFTHNDHVYAVELLAFKSRWEKGNHVLEKVLKSLTFFD